VPGTSSGYPAYELRNAVIHEPALKAILEKESTLEYRRLTIKWVNAGSWIVDAAGTFGPQDQVMFADNSLEISRTRRRPVNLYISVGDSLPKSRIKTAIEITLDVRLKSVM
jgi:hypothetical protein